MNIDLVWFCRPLRTVGIGGSWKREWRRMVVRAHCDRDPLLKLTDGVAECDAPSFLSPFILILKNCIISCRIRPEYSRQMPWLTVVSKVSQNCLQVVPKLSQNHFKDVPKLRQSRSCPKLTQSFPKVAQELSLSCFKVSFLRSVFLLRTSLIWKMGAAAAGSLVSRKRYKISWRR